MLKHLFQLEIIKSLINICYEEADVTNWTANIICLSQLQFGNALLQALKEKKHDFKRIHIHGTFNIRNTRCIIFMLKFIFLAH